jgi:mono/diheme cytochrome c family protein
MHHRIIRRAAIGLTTVLVFIALAFGWGTLFREQRLAARDAPAGEPAPYDPAAAAAAYEERCTMCHGPARDNDGWMAGTPSERLEAAFAEFLAGHAKAPAAENRILAKYLAELGVQKNQ